MSAHGLRLCLATLTLPIGLLLPIEASAGRAPSHTLAVPEIASFTPAGGPIGTLVSITGSGFTGATAVRFNGRSTSFSVTSDAQITATVPSLATTGPITVTTSAGTDTSASSFFVGTAASVSGFSPGYGGPGTPVTITGSSFIGATAVRFGGHAASFSVISASQINATVPPGAVTGFISVSNPAGTGTSGSVFYLPPVITGFSPAGAPFGSEIFIYGTGFSIAQSVRFNGTDAGFNIYSDGQMSAYVPGDATTGLIEVISPAGSGSSGVSFFVGDSPSVYSFLPTGGPVGTEVTVQGAGFVGVQDVSFAGVAAAFVVDSPNQLRAIVPAGAIAGTIAVSNPAGTGTSGSSFFVGTAPTITNVSPPYGPVGIPVTLTGSGFTGVSMVLFGGTPSPFSIVNDGQITTSVPAGAVTGSLVVTNPAGSDSSGQVFGVSPTIETFDPSCVASLYRDTTQVVILGTNFTGATSVQVNDLATVFTVEGDGQIRCGVPQGDVDGPVSVTTPYGTAVSQGNFRIIQLEVPPKIPGQEWPHGYAENVPASNAPADQTNLVSVSDGVGGVIEVWQDSRTGDARIYAQRITLHGYVASGWPAAGLAVAPGPASQTMPAATADGAGGVIVAWRDSRSGTGDIYAQHVMSDGTIEATWPAPGLPICAAPGEQSAPAIAADRSCGALITWEDYRNGQSDIYAQHVTALGAIAQGWASDGNPVCTQGSYQYLPAIAADGVGGALIAWRDDRNCQHVFVQRMTSQGQIAAGWPIDGSQASSYCQAQAPRVESDGSGGAYVAWRNDGCYSNAMLQRFTSQGAIAPGWSSSGLSLNQYCRQGSADEVRAVPDGAGGVYVLWTERTGYGQADIMMHRITSAGLPADGWPQYGTRITSDPSDQFASEMTTDAFGGVIVTWHDLRSGAFDVYSQRIFANGTIAPAWGGNARVSTAPSVQLEPTIVASQGGTAIVSWQDYRFGGGSRIFTQLIDGAGKLGNAQPEILSVSDVPADQGGQVRVKWAASYLDSLPTLEIGAYGIWRQVSGPIVTAAAKRGARVVQGEASASDAAPGVYRKVTTSTETTYWEGVGSILARGYQTYTYVAPTLMDSMAAGNPLTIFMVDAHAAFFPYFWSSAPDSGYSADDLPPGAPQGFAAAQVSGGVRLSWLPNVENDLAGYRLYRGASPDFMPATENLVASVADTGHTDPDGNATFTYKIVAVDIHGNPSGVVAVQPTSLAGVGADCVPQTLWLGTAQPNPARTSSTIRMGFPRTARASLTIYDPAGRAVRKLLDGDVRAGEVVVAWDARDDMGKALPSGVYLYRLESASKVITRRIVLVR